MHKCMMNFHLPFPCDVLELREALQIIPDVQFPLIEVTGHLLADNILIAVKN